MKSLDVNFESTAFKIVDLTFRTILIFVFGIAAAAKVAEPKMTRKAMRFFGVPSSAVTYAAYTIPVLEMSIAVLLISRKTATVASSIAIILLAVFTILAIYNISIDRRFDCMCFGKLFGSQIGWPMIVRNVILILIGIYILCFETVDRKGRHIHSCNPIVFNMSPLYFEWAVSLLVLFQLSIIVLLFRQASISESYLKTILSELHDGVSAEKSNDVRR